MNISVLIYTLIFINYSSISFIHRLNTLSESDGKDSSTSSLNINKCDYLEITAEEGVMIIMPSWLHHAVIPLSVQKQYRQKKEGMRISLAFNFNEI